ncbi:MAG TPA: PilZ domain-containing protein [Vicinamibacterales bacterium]|nr:PilZ domain-containing protein [Vicinamibacterales bacterium]
MLARNDTARELGQTPGNRINRRRHPRVAGPFDGVRIGALDTPVRIYDLSRGGCFVNSFMEEKEGVCFPMKIELPYGGWIEVIAETLYSRDGLGYAVRFTEMTGETASRLELALTKLRSHG